MDEHIHTGFVTFVTVTVYAILGIWVVRFAAAKLVDLGPTEPVGRALGAVVHFGS